MRRGKACGRLNSIASTGARWNRNGEEGGRARRGYFLQSRAFGAIVSTSEVGHAVAPIGLLANEPLGAAGLRGRRVDDGQGLQAHGRLFQFLGEELVLEPLSIQFLPELRSRLGGVGDQHRMVEEGTRGGSLGRHFLDHLSEKLVEFW